MIGVNLKGDRLGKIQTEDAQDGLAIYHMATHAQINVIGITIGDVDEGLDISARLSLIFTAFIGSVSSLIDIIREAMPLDY